MTEGLGLISPFLLPFAIYIDAVVVDLVATCSQDPPPAQTWSVADIQNFIGGILNPNFPSALAKLQATFNRWFWGQYCQCSTGNLTQNPQAPVLPPPTLTVPVSSGNAPCFAGSFTIPAGSGHSSSSSQYVDYTRTVLPVTGNPIALADPSNSIWLGSPVQSFSEIDLRWTNPGNTLCSTTSTDVAIFLGFWAQNGQFLRSHDVSQQAAQSGGVNLFGTQPPANTFYVAVAASGPESPNCGVTINPCNVSGTIYCSGSSTSIVSPCASDPEVLALLQRIYALEQSIASAIPTPLRSYSESTLHSPLVGNGSFGVQAQTLAVRFNLTTIPSPVGQRGGSPIEYLDVGWVAAVTTEGPIVPTRLVYSPQLLVLPVLTTTIDYSLTPGVVASGLELLRGP